MIWRKRKVLQWFDTTVTHALQHRAYISCYSLEIYWRKSVMNRAHTLSASLALAVCNLVLLLDLSYAPNVYAQSIQPLFSFECNSSTNVCSNGRSPKHPHSVRGWKFIWHHHPRWQQQQWWWHYLQKLALEASSRFSTYLSPTRTETTLMALSRRAWSKAMTAFCMARLEAGPTVSVMEWHSS